MQPTRRRLLTAGGAALASVAGCVGTDSGVEYPEEATGVAKEGADTVATEDEKRASRRSTAEPGPSALAERTRGIVSDVNWFATEYESAIATTMAANEAVVESIEAATTRIRRVETTPPEVLTELEAVTDEAAETATEAMSPHFDPASHIETLADRHLEVLHRFADRGDTERVLEELDRMATAFGDVANRLGLTRRYSRRPIHNRLHRRFLAADPNGRVVRFRHPPTSFSGLAYTPHRHLPPDSDYVPLTFYGPPIGDDRQAELEALLGPVRAPDEREDELYVVVSNRPERPKHPDRPYEGPPEALGGKAMYVQQYPDPEAAEDAFGRITASAATEGTERVLGSTPWYRLYYQDGLAVTYGYLGRAGSFLLAFGFSGTAWEERVSWQGTLPAFWVADE